jgi:flagellar hook assembly protein FlgD
MTLRRLLAASAALATLVTPLAVSAAAPADAADTFFVRMEKKAVFLSPDGDGRRDFARIAFDLGKRAQVSVSVSHHGVVLFAKGIDLGTLDAGRHYWKFEGRDSRGHLLPDDDYEVQVVATRHGKKRSAYANAFIATQPDRGTLLVSRPTVYPRATAVDDRILVTYLREGWDPNRAAYPGDGFYVDLVPLMPLRVHLFVLDGRGERVYRDTERKAYTPVLAWDGTRGGKPVKAGKYTVKVFVADPAGNHSSYTQNVRVSNRQLEQQTWSTTVSAADALTYSAPYPPSCNGCSEGCAPVPSTRFAGGLSFPACTTDGLGGSTSRYFTMPVPFAAAPVDRFRVSATGGPTDPASASIGHLGDTQVGPGDATAWTPWAAAKLGAAPYLPDQASPVSWHFYTGAGSSYDVASFTVEYRYYVPVTAG